jgi:hemerythrin-like domain-containing protein
MLVKLGRKQPPAPGDLAALLLECHERIRSFVRLARDLAASPTSPAASTREAAARVRRYFVEALPLHVADEEESIAPRLRGRSPELDRALEQMCAEHAEHDAAVGRLVALCGALEVDPGRIGALTDELGAAASHLAELFAAHLEAEERVVIPALGVLLSEGEREAVVSELRARRRGPS